ncbi:hypothetical protein HJB53_29940 [Rhizobium lentis]|uniref:hypothetical protein n=1 Tax=Rhizobium lentis TaxID=1138194 RepID=UPI001C83844C|nr:hypothetical protein [Rhizobium lentis]MBX5130712.1 hypothetical protein [Rhizobium lentis]
MTRIKRIEWAHTNTRSMCSGLTGHFDIKFDIHEWAFDYRAPGSTASVLIGRYPNRTAAMNKAQEIHEQVLAPYFQIESVSQEMRQAADKARNDWLASDGNDQIGALNAALDAAFNCR